MSERIAKRLARAGVASRREAERMIEAGRIAVNGERLTTPACVVTEADEVRVDGKPLAGPASTALYRYHKPSGLVVSDRDEQGRPTIFEAIARTYPDLPRLISVGRLDLNSEGLLLLTNDGDLARHLEHPKTGWTRRYRVRGRGRPDPDRLSELAKGARIEGERFGPIQVAVRETTSGETRPRANLWFDVALSEGKNREVRRALAWAGVDVNRLIRVGYGPFQLGDLDVGEVDKLRPRVLIDQLGKAWAERVKESGAERRAGPLRERQGGKASPPRRQDEAGHAHRRRRS